MTTVNMLPQAERSNLFITMRTATLVFLLLASPVQASELPDVVERGDWASVPATIEQEDAKATQPDGMTALHWAVRHCRPALVKRLLAAKADPNAVSYYGVTPLSVASQFGFGNIVETLCAAGADPNVAVAGKVTPLMLASHAGHVEVVRQLLDAGAKVDAKQSKGQTALMFAADAGHVSGGGGFVEGGR